MNLLKSLKLTIVALLLSALLAGCDGMFAPAPTLVPAIPAVTPVPTDTSTATPSPSPTATVIPPTATPTPHPAPQSGHWEGEKPSIAFDIADGGKLLNFRIAISLPATSRNSCVVTVPEITLATDASFEFSTVFRPAADKAPLDSNRITGVFTSATNVIGTYGGKNLIVCTDSQNQTSFLITTEQAWSATWKRP